MTWCSFSCIAFKETVHCSASTWPCARVSSRTPCHCVCHVDLEGPCARAAGHSSDTVHDEEAGCGPCAGCVAIVTGDYAMQNVALQMGMRLLAPDGAHITRIARWALRCSACFKVSLVTARSFLPDLHVLGRMLLSDVRARQKGISHFTWRMACHACQL